MRSAATVKEEFEGGMRQTFAQVVERFGLKPDAVGIVPLHVSDGTESVDWSMLVVR